MISSDPKITSADAERLRNLYGLDKPLIERYWNWLSAALSGDLGLAALRMGLRGKGLRGTGLRGKGLRPPAPVLIPAATLSSTTLG